MTAARSGIAKIFIGPVRLFAVCMWRVPNTIRRGFPIRRWLILAIISFARRNGSQYIAKMRIFLENVGGTMILLVTFSARLIILSLWIAERRENFRGKLMGCSLAMTVRIAGTTYAMRQENLGVDLDLEDLASFLPKRTGVFFRQVVF